jgi:hypothetical protein
MDEGYKMDDLEQIEYLFNNFYSNSVNYICINNGLSVGIINIEKPGKITLPSNYEEIIEKYSNEYKINNIEGKIRYFIDLPDIHLSSINDYPIIFHSIKCDVSNSIIIESTTGSNIESVNKVQYYKYNGLDLCQEAYNAHKLSDNPDIKMIKFDNYIYCIKCKKIYIPGDDPGTSSDNNKNNGHGAASSSHSANDKSSIPQSFNKSIQCRRSDSMDSINENINGIYNDINTTNSNSYNRLFSHNKFDRSLFKESTNLNTNNLTTNSLTANSLINYPNTILNELYTDRSNITFRKLLTHVDIKNNDIIECHDHLYKTDLTNIQYSCIMSGYGSMLDWIPILKKIYSYGYILLNCNPESINYGKIAFQKIDDDTDMDYIVFK